MFIIASSQVHRTIRVDLRYLCSLIIKQLSRVRLLLRVLGAIRVRHTQAAQPTGLFVRFAILVFFKPQASFAPSVVSVVPVVFVVLKTPAAQPTGLFVRFAILVFF